MDLKEIDILGTDIDQHWYYQSKASAMQRLLGADLPGSILDVGAGSGFFSRHLLRHTSAREAWCVDTSYTSEGEAEEAGKPLYFRRQLDQAPADLVLLMDVLEHVDDDLGLLRAYADKVAAGCRFLITVPAFSFLWSGHDLFLEHRRRYTLGEIEALVRKAGLTVRRGVYYFGLVFPLAAAARLGGSGREARSQLRRHHPASNALLKTLCQAELPLMPFNRLAGLSVFCLAEKP